MNGVPPPSVYNKPQSIFDWKKQTSNNTSVDNKLSRDLEDKIQLEKCRCNNIEMHETEVGGQVYGICKGAVLALKGKIEAEVAQYLSPETFKYMSDLFSNTSSDDNNNNNEEEKIAAI